MAGCPREQTCGVGIGATDYAQRTRQLIKLITDLRGVGAQADIDLPRIAVIGNQSAGKSSLVEAISGITVPRASGTCTRCPMECRLQNTAGPWRCQVSLRFERDDSGQRLAEVHEKPFGPMMTDKSQLEETLRRAQLAILNPTIPHTSFLDLDTSKVVNGQPPIGFEKPLQFSTNVVTVDLWGPDLADLAFIDLPGIISNVGEGEDRNNISLVQELVKEHIKGNALILLTLTMRDDMENQSAAFLAKEADPEGLRTIGVLTKADTVLPGEEPGWLDVLYGRRHPLKKGYYVTKQPGPEELRQKPSFEEARSQEKIFFATKEPWKSSTSQVRSRMGIPNLTTELSKLLSHLIMQTLPKLREDARKEQNATIVALGKLPPPMPDNPVIELLRLLTVFSTATKKWIDATEQYQGLVQVFNAASAELKKNLLQTAPNFRPFEDEDEEDLATDPFTNPDEDTVDGGEISPPVYLSEVRAHIKNSLGRELPYNIPFSAKRTLIEASFGTWRHHASEFFATICQATSKQLDEEIEKVFGQFFTSPLKDHVQSVVDRQLDHFRKQTCERINWFLDMETPPFTQNLRDFSSCRDLYLARYKAARKGLKSTTLGSPTAALRELAYLGFQGLTVDELYKLTKAGDHEQELIVMAEVRAYWRIAYKRIIDDMPRIVDHDFLIGLGRSLPNTLSHEFGIGNENAIQRASIYLAEDPNDVAKRKELRGKEQRLDEVLKKLFNFGF